jgi:stearoyl-CoA desaturase (delta-9 desaturase)
MVESRARVYVIESIRWAIHLGAVAGVVTTGWSAIAVGVCIGAYCLGMLAIGVAYHRYFAHRSYQTSRAFQFVLAVWGSLSLQRGPIWWASVHRHHHRHADTTEDYHSPRRGFWHAHTGWLLSPKVYAVDYRNVSDLTPYRELRWLDRWYHLPSLAFIALLWAAGAWLARHHPELRTNGAQLFVWGFLVRTTLLWQATFSINSLMHMIGTQRYATHDDSRNSFWLALVTMGEGWHNNHHRLPACARNGFYWWEIDCNYYFIKLLQGVGLVRDVREVPPAVRAEGREHPPIGLPTRVS